MSGITPKLPLTKNTLNDYACVTDYRELVKQNFRILMYTIPGERMMDLNFGIGLIKFLFEPDSPKLYGRISAKIKQQVERYLPYIKITNIVYNSVKNDFQIDPSFLSVGVEYIILPLDVVDKLELTLPED